MDDLPVLVCSQDYSMSPSSFMKYAPALPTCSLSLSPPWQRHRNPSQSPCPFPPRPEAASLANSFEGRPSFREKLQKWAPVSPALGLAER